MADAAPRDHEMEGFIDQAVKVYRECCKVSSVTRATLRTKGEGVPDTDCEICVTSEWSQRDLDRNEIRKFQRNHTLTLNKGTGVFSGMSETAFPNELNNQQLSSESPSGKLKAVVQKVSAKQKEDENQIIEIWSTCGLVKSIDVNAAEKHGKILDEGPFKFGCLQWSPSEKFLLYAAEKKQPETVSYFDKHSKGSETSGKPKPTKGDQFLYKEDWGEQMVGVSHPVLVILDVESEEMKVIEGIPDYLSAGQVLALWSGERWGDDVKKASWCQGEESIVFTGWWHEPYRLGLVYCTNRRSGVFLKTLDSSKPEQISDSQFSVYSPRLSPLKDKLVYIAVDFGGPHMNCGRLMLYDLKSKSSTTVIDVVGVPKVNDFPGIFVTFLPRRCWSVDGSSVIFDSAWRSAKHVLMVDLNNKSIQRLTRETGSWTVLDVHNDVVMCSTATPTSPPRLVIATLPSGTSTSPVSWTTVAMSNCELRLEAEMRWEIMCFTLPDEPREDLNKQYEAIFIAPKSQESSQNPPLVVFPHGGPHSFFAADFMLHPVAMCRVGFAVLLVNYRGSIGFGQSSLLSLPGKIGTQDVQEVQFAASTMQSSGRVDPDNVFITGGSHGGFLTAHLTGQFPDFYKASALRNPVFNIPSMAGVTDIPDWSYFESSLSYDYGQIPIAETNSSMLDKSPIIHSSKIKTPTLVLLGDVDRRVPPSEGKELYRILKSRGVKAKLLLYPDNNHPLSKVDAESDVFINTVRWFHEHLQQRKTV